MSTRPAPAAAERRAAPTAAFLRAAVPALALIVAAAVVTAAGAAAGWEHTRWLALHLYLVGGASGLILGAASFFTGLYMVGGETARRLRAAQVIAWNAGVIVVSAGVLADAVALTALGGALLLAGLGAFAAGLHVQRRRIGPRRGWLVRWYLAAAGLLVVGVALGVAISRDPLLLPGDGIGAHRTLNLVGWIGGAIVGTAHILYPAVTHTRLAYPRLEPAAFAAWLGGTAAAALGYGLGVDALTALGYAGILAAGLLLVANVAACARRSRRLGLAAQLIAAGQVMLVLGIGLVLAATLSEGTVFAGRARDALLELLAAGWVGLTILGALVHLLGTIGRSAAPAGPYATPLRALALTLLAGIGLLVVVASELLGGTQLDVPARTAVGIAYLLVAVQVARLAAGAVRAVRARPAAGVTAATSRPPRAR